MASVEATKTLQCKNGKEDDFYLGIVTYCHIQGQGNLPLYESYTFEKGSRHNTNVNMVRFNMTKMTIVPANDILDQFPNLSFLWIGNANLTLIGQHDFENFVPLKYLGLPHNQISYIHESAFSKLTLLTRIDLKENRLKSLGENLFTNNHNLISLDFRRNRIERVYPNLFTDLKHLYEVEFDHNVCVNRGFSKNFGSGAGVFSNFLPSMETCFRNYITLTFNKLI
jgi:hypothetical protein